jgi:hypothetical protein
VGARRPSLKKEIKKLERFSMSELLQAILYFNERIIASININDFKPLIYIPVLEYKPISVKNENFELYYMVFEFS